MMKLSKREKILLSVMTVMLLTGGYYKFVFSPQRERLNTLTQQKTEYESKKKDIDAKIASKSKVETDIKVLNSKLHDMTIMLFPAIKQEYIIVYIDKVLSEASLRGVSIAFSDIKAVPVESVKAEEKNDKSSSLKDVVDEYNGVQVKKNTENTQSEKKDDKDKPSAENISLTITFKGPHKNLMDFVKALESYSKKIVVSNLKISQGGTDGVTGSMQLEFYAIPKISDEDKDFFKWEFNNTYGKDNPFDGKVETSALTSIIEDIVKNKERSYDFVMNVRSTSSDLPTIMLGRSKDITKSTYVYGDNPQAESVEMYLTKKDNKYYYKYKTSRDKYPTQFDGDGVEFTAQDSINFKIYSNKRSDSTDNSGANIKIYNKTDKTVNVNIERDDDIKPRVSVSGEGGSVQITRN